VVNFIAIFLKLKLFSFKIGPTMRVGGQEQPANPTETELLSQESVHEVVLQESIPAQIRRLTLYIY
jgi:hypothetical protein